MKSAGGFNAFASQYMPFEIITPQVHSVTVQGTTLSGELRSTTGKSMSGNEIPWIDNGFESVALNGSASFVLYGTVNVPVIVSSDKTSSNISVSEVLIEI